MTKVNIFTARAVTTQLVTDVVGWTEKEKKVMLADIRPELALAEAALASVRGVAGAAIGAAGTVFLGFLGISVAAPIAIAICGALGLGAAVASPLINRISGVKKLDGCYEAGIFCCINGETLNDRRKRLKETLKKFANDLKAKYRGMDTKEHYGEMKNMISKEMVESHNSATRHYVM